MAHVVAGAVQRLPATSVRQPGSVMQLRHDLVRKIAQM